jgi:hypothetical protein
MAFQLRAVYARLDWRSWSSSMPIFSIRIETRYVLHQKPASSCGFSRFSLAVGRLKPLLRTLITISTVADSLHPLDHICQAGAIQNVGDGIADIQHS